MVAPHANAAYRAQGISVHVVARTDVGMVRPNNEDAFVCGDLTSGASLSSSRIGPAGVLLGVCDGMGGAAAGEVASRIAAATVLKEMSAVSVHVEPPEFASALSSAVEKAAVAIKENAREYPERAGMGTTCTMVAVRGALLLVAQVGDSRAYLFRAGTLRQLTNDQTLANLMLAKGAINPEEAANLEDGHHIVQAVGTCEKLAVELTSIELAHGDKVLVCSDGLSGMVSDEQIARVLALEGKELETASDELVAMANAAGGRDNITFVIGEFTGSRLRPDSLPLSNRREPALHSQVGRWLRLAAALLALGTLTSSIWWVLGSMERASSKSARGDGGSNSVVMGPGAAGASSSAMRPSPAGHDPSSEPVMLPSTDEVPAMRTSAAGQRLPVRTEPPARPAVRKLAELPSAPSSEVDLPIVSKPEPAKRSPF